MSHVNLHVLAETKDLIVKALGERAIMGFPASLDELLQDWAVREAAGQDEGENDALSRLADVAPPTAPEPGYAYPVVPEEQEFTEPPATVTTLPVWARENNPADSVATTPEPGSLASYGAPLPDAEPVKKGRRTKVQMQEARDAVVAAYSNTVGSSPWAAGWEAAHVAGLAAAQTVGFQMLLTPYQTSQSLTSDLVDSERAKFDEPTQGSQRVEAILASEVSPVPLPDVNPDLLINIDEAEAADRVVRDAELFEIVVDHTPDSPTDDDIFRQFLGPQNG